jgi:hypothetical protein
MWITAFAAMGTLLLAEASSALACSPPFEPITIRGLGPQQVVVVGTIGERVAGGRIFHVERWFNGGVPSAEIVIAFKEGEAVGDCSYPVQTGQHLIIAPILEADGRLSADLVTLQADPASDVGQAYLREATALYGPGVVPPAAEPATEPSSSDRPWFIAAAALVTLVVVAAVAVAWRRTSTRPR